MVNPLLSMQHCSRLTSYPVFNNGRYQNVLLTSYTEQSFAKAYGIVEDRIIGGKVGRNILFDFLFAGVGIYTVSSMPAFMLNVFVQLGAMVNRVSEFSVLGWFGWARFVNCICDLLVLNPQIDQVPTSHIMLFP
ncbi:unnamed protein product [Arabis nemorensis]|uniref:Uncharacterized protein n=1 Tax=Arabis nemorensis TaxID=586526 RepID=A0A565BV85_9BRAS|nr:unnamed protein product [Arabis nemorensis]